MEFHYKTPSHKNNIDVCKLSNVTKPARLQPLLNCQNVNFITTEYSILHMTSTTTSKLDKSLLTQI